MRGLRAFLLFTSTAVAGASTVSCGGDENAQFSDVVTQDIGADEL
jgi:hypothetical protein